MRRAWRIGCASAALRSATVRILRAWGRDGIASAVRQCGKKMMQLLAMRCGGRGRMERMALNLSCCRGRCRTRGRACSPRRSAAFSGRTVIAWPRSRARTWRSTRFITDEGGEMGRAQVVQAEAAGIEPDVRMNPILLKPTTDVWQPGHRERTRCVGNMRATEYYRRKREFLPAVMAGLSRALRREYDIIVIEGAGSPAEINLQAGRHRQHGAGQAGRCAGAAGGRHRPRRRVRPALRARSRCWSRTSDRRRVKGVVVNKFRGDRAILEPGLRHA